MMKNCSGVIRMYCRNCGASVDRKAEVCVSCGVRPLNGKDFCQECGAKTNANQEICIKCGVKLARFAPDREEINPDFRGLSQYYQLEFSKIYESNDRYTGKWNWAAFFFGAFWAFTKGLWAIALIALVLSIVSYGTLGPVIWIYFGIRGNYIYYNRYAKGKQLSF